MTKQGRGGGWGRGKRAGVRAQGASEEARKSFTPVRSRAQYVLLTGACSEDSDRPFQVETCTAPVLCQPCAADKGTCNPINLASLRMTRSRAFLTFTSHFVLSPYFFWV